MDLTGRSVVLTGAGSGIGRATALALARKGCRLVLLGRRAPLLESVADEARTVGGLAHVVAGDVTDAGVRTRAIEAAAAEYGGLDVLVNNAGAVRGGRLGWAKEDEIRAMVEVNLLAPILLAREALILLRRGGDAAILNVSCDEAVVPAPFYATYAGTKAGLAGFGEALRREMLGEGVRVVTIHAGPTGTAMLPPGQELSGPRAAPAAPEAVARAIISLLEAGKGEHASLGEAAVASGAAGRDGPAEASDNLRRKAALEAAATTHVVL